MRLAGLGSWGIIPAHLDQTREVEIHMKVTTERLENCQVRVVIELEQDEIDKKLRQTARQISRQFNLPGYRRGKAPFHAVVRIVGREAVQQQALEDSGDELYEEALKEIEYEPFQSGELESVEWDPFRMTVLLPIPPEVDLSRSIWRACKRGSASGCPSSGRRPLATRWCWIWRAKSAINCS